MAARGLPQPPPLGTALSPPPQQRLTHPSQPLCREAATSPTSSLSSDLFRGPSQGSSSRVSTRRKTLVLAASSQCWRIRGRAAGVPPSWHEASGLFFRSLFGLQTQAGWIPVTGTGMRVGREAARPTNAPIPGIGPAGESRWHSPCLVPARRMSLKWRKGRLAIRCLARPYCAVASVGRGRHPILLIPVPVTGIQQPRVHAAEDSCFRGKLAVLANARRSSRRSSLLT